MGAAVLLVGLAGCVGPPSAPMPVPSPSSTPVFASDEEALAAAEVAYGEYLAVLDRALSTVETAELKRVASGRALSEAIESVEGFRSDKHHLTGNSSFDTASLTQAEYDGRVDIYVCWDITNTDVVDEAGRSTVPIDRPSRFPMQVSFEWIRSESALLVIEAEVWDGENFCA